MDSPHRQFSFNPEMDRRGFLRTVGGAAALTAAYGFVNIPTARAQATTQRNLLLIITDQERAIRWFPDGWAEANLPAFTELKNTGILFDHCCINTAMCTPSRNTIFTGLFPAQHLSFNTLTEGFVQSESEHQLDPTLPNLATALKAAGYEVVYKGKWHMSKGVDGCDDNYIEDDITRYGFDLWDPPDAGQDIQIAHYGGGTADNDGRFISDAVAYLQDKVTNPGTKPFCLVVSLVNPHDVLGYPGNHGTGGYTAADLLGDIEIPPTYDESLITNIKPTCQEAMLLKLNGLGPIVTDVQRRAYVNFYGNLMKLVDSQIGQLLDVFSSSAQGQTLRNNTWIVRTADHGEMAMCHGGLRQKAFNTYEETIRVPLLWSNPIDFPTGRESSELVSHVDLLPTICSMLSVPGWEGYNFSGIDYSSLIQDAAALPVQDYILFTFDDIWAAQNADGFPQGIVPPPNRIQMIRQKFYKYSRYYDGDGIQPDEQEFYDLRPAALGGTDVDPTTGVPVELENISVWAEAIRVFTGQSPIATAEQIAKRFELSDALPQIVAARLQPRPAGSPVPPQNFQTQTVTWTDTNGQTQSAIEITWVSRSTTQYQLQRSRDGKAWRNVGTPVVGNNGPLIICQPVTNPSYSYRLAWGAISDVAPQPEPYIEVNGSRRRTVQKSRFSLHGKTNAPGNRIEYKIGGEGGRIRSRVTHKNNWTLPIRGLRLGKNLLYVRARNPLGVVSAWKKIIVEREK